MADRSIKVRLSAQVTDFTREMDKAATSLDKVVKKSGDASGAANTTMGRLAQSARLQSDAWNTAGGALVGMGAAITGVNALVAKTGIEYNTLQQKSRAALTTILGGAEAANAQMDKLDEFARTSPFAKQTFITAQQQMLAFGIESQKVIPYLDAINDAVAASGGNSQMLGEVAFVIAQIGAAGKITAQDLMQLGQRGINAAELIGSQMGKTGAQIRADISDGALGADAALDALAAGMSQRFEGASANVKNTMEGAFDRVKAAWRDLSAEMMSGAVGPEGGGWLVDLTNGVADLMRAVQKLPDPVKEAVGGLSVFTGAGALAAGSVALAVPKFLEVRKAFTELAEVSPRVASGVGAVGKAAGIAAGALVALTVMDAVATAFQEAVPAADDYAAALERVRRASDNLQAGEAVGSLFDAQGIGMALEEANALKAWYDSMNWFINPAAHLTGERAARQNSSQRVSTLDSQLSSAAPETAARTFAVVAEEAERAGLSTRALLDLFPEYEAALNRAAAEAGLKALTDEQMLAAMQGMSNPIQEATNAYQGWSAAVEQYHRESRTATEASETMLKRMEEEAEAAKQAEKEWREYLNTLAGGSQAFVGIDSALDATQAKHRETAESMAESTKSGKDSWEDFYDGVSVSLSQYMAELQKQIDAQNAWEQNMLALSGRVSQGMIDHLAELGPKGAPLVEQLVNASEDELARMEKLYGDAGSAASMNFAEALADGGPVWAELGAKFGAETVDRAKALIAAGQATLQDIIDRYNLKGEMELDTEPAEASAHRFLGGLDGTEVRAQLGIDTNAAERAARAALDRISRMDVTVDVKARILNRSGFDAPVATGGYMADIAAAYNHLSGGGQARVRPSGYLSGPGTGTSDSIPARLSTKEFVVNASATQHYGPDFLYRLNSRSVDRDWLHSLGLAGGGSPSIPAPTSAPVASMVTRSSSTVNIGQINVTTQAGTADGILAEVARELPAFFAQRG